MKSNEVIKFFLFGDSICFGQLVGSHHTWATCIAAGLESYGGNEKQFLVQNAGVNGNTTRQALERLTFDVLSHSPKYVLIQFGMNDCNIWKDSGDLERVSPDAFKANLLEIVNKCFGAGVRHCFLSTNHLSLKGEFAHTKVTTYDNNNIRYNFFIREVANYLNGLSLPVTLLDNEAVWENYLIDNENITLNDLLLDDGVHLSTLGHELYKKTTVNDVLIKIRSIESV